MKDWFYGKEGRTYGPIPEDDLLRLLAAAQLAPETLVWTSGMAVWARACDVEGLLSRAVPPAPPSSAEAMTQDPDAASVGQIRPWVRYWARTVDLIVYFFAMGAVLAGFYPSALAWPSVYLSIFLMLACIVVEPVFLSFWGTTPGKALLRVRVRRADGGRLSFREALLRTAKVWVYGLGLGIPIVTLFTHLQAYNRLTTRGVTWWDEEGGLQVTHGRIGLWRTAAAFLLLVLSISLMVVASMEQHAGR